MPPVNPLQTPASSRVRFGTALRSTCAGGADGTVRLWSLGSAAAAAEAATGPGKKAGVDATKPQAQLKPLRTLRTKSTPVFALHFTPRNLLLGSGALTLPRRRRPTETPPEKPAG
jgi:hypothetical protein